MRILIGLFIIVLFSYTAKVVWGEWKIFKKRKVLEATYLEKEVIDLDKQITSNRKENKKASRKIYR